MFWWDALLNININKNTYSLYSPAQYGHSQYFMFLNSESSIIIVLESNLDIIDICYSKMGKKVWI